MQSSREFVFAIIIVSASCAAVELLIPDGSSVSKYVRFLVSLIITVILLSPLHKLPVLMSELTVGYGELNITKDDSYLSAYADSLALEVQSEIAGELSSELEKRFKVKPYDIQVHCNSDDTENIVIEKVIITLSKHNTLLISDLVKFTENLLGCDCEVKTLEEAES